ncbi:hypothetical protein JCM5296_006035 [Sporobolomyces johnsonii]
MPWKDTRPAAQSGARFKSDPDPAILALLHDAHCHPSDDASFSPDVLRRLHTGAFCAMSSSLSNQDKTKEVYQARPNDVVPCFGLHPWFCHPISLQPPESLPSKSDHYTSLFPSPSSPTSPHPSLDVVLPIFPDPVPLATFLSTLESDLVAHPTSMVGEIGLDKAFHIPNPPEIAADKRNPKHTDLATPVAHQLAVVEAQVDLAIRLRRNISLHSVRAAQDTVDMLKRFKAKPGWERIYVCLHSFGGSPESAKQIQRTHHNVFFSFATIISARSPNFHNLLRAIEPDRLLTESDFSTTNEIDNQIWEVFEAILEARDWSAARAVAHLSANWRRFTAPESARPPPPKSSKERKRDRRHQDLYVSEEEEDDDARDSIATT